MLVGLNNAEGWGTTPAATVLADGIRCGRVELGSTGSPANLSAWGFQQLQVVANSDDGTLITTLNNTTQANLAVSQVQAAPAAVMLEFMNEPYFKGGQAHAVKYARLYMAALTALRAAGINTKLLYHGYGSFNNETTTQSCTLTSGSPIVAMTSTDEIVLDQAISGTNIPAGSWVASLNADGTHFTIGNAGSPNAQASGSSSVTFTSRWSNPGSGYGYGWIGRPALTVSGLAAAILDNGVSLHPYGMPTEDTAGHANGIASVAWQASALASWFGSAVDIWVTEFGYRIDGATSGATTGVLVFDNTEQATRLTEAMTAMEAVSAVKGVFWYQLGDDTLALKWGLLDRGSLTFRPSLAAYAAFVTTTQLTLTPATSANTAQTLIGPLTTTYVSVRERAPLQLTVDIETDDGRHTRWGLDEPDAANVPQGLQCASTMPGGFESFTCKLARSPKIDYADLAPYSTLTAYGAGGECAWQGRLESTPRTSGTDMAITPGAVGWQAHLDDDETVRFLGIDQRTNVWTGATNARKVSTVSYVDITDPVAEDDLVRGGVVDTALTGPWGRLNSAEAWYNGYQQPISRLYYAWQAGSTLVVGDTRWTGAAWLFGDDLAANGTMTPDLLFAGGGTLGSGSLDAGTNTRDWAMLQLLNGLSGGTAITYPMWWGPLAVLGTHGIPTHGAFSASPGTLGLYAAEVLRYLIPLKAPKLAIGRAGASTIADSSIALPQVAYLESVTKLSQIVTDLTRFELQDWGVFEGPTFWWGPRNSLGRRWRARVGPSGLQETGVDASKCWNSVVVQYNDVNGTARTVGPIGSGSDVEDTALTDSDPANPATAAGLTRRTTLTMGVSTYDKAILIGANFLAEQKLLNTAGQATIKGYVEDDHGVFYPVWAMRAGDLIAFTDSHDAASYRRIVRANYSAADATCQIDLDAPPDALAAVLERLSVGIQPFGLT